MNFIKYHYISYSKLPISSQIDSLINASLSWEYVKGRCIDEFDFKKWKESARSRFDFIIPSCTKLMKTDIAKAIFQILISDKYRKGPVENILSHQKIFLEMIEDRVRQNEPIEIIIPSFPGRPSNLLKRTRAQPGLSELASLTRFWELSEHIKTVYNPGLRCIICLDGRPYYPIYGYTPQGADPYINDLKRFISKMKIADSVLLVDLFDLVQEREKEFKEIHPSVVDELKSDWESSRFNSKEELIETMKLGANMAPLDIVALKLIKFHGFDFDEVIPRVQKAVFERAKKTAFNYMVFLVTIKRMNLLQKKFPFAIRGTVHPKSCQYSPHFIDQFNEIPPWHGVAIVNLDGRISCVCENEVLENPDRYTAVYLKGEYEPFYYEINSLSKM